MNYPSRKGLQVGLLVEIQQRNNRIRGYIFEILSQQPTDKGVKVRLHSGEEGRVLRIVTKEEVQRENFIFYNRLLHEKTLYSLFDNNNKRYWTWENSKKESFSVLYQKKEEIASFLRELKMHGLTDNVSVRALPRKLALSTVFSKAGAQFLIIDRTRKISLVFLNEVELRIGS